jgi:hypothetical protein
MAQFVCAIDGETFEQKSAYEWHLASAHPPRAPSAADVEKALAGIDYPKSRDELVAYAASRLPADSPVLKLIHALPDRVYHDAAEVAVAIGELKGKPPMTPSRRGGQTAATRAVSAASVAKILAGIDLPANKAKILRHARENRQRVESADEVIEVLEQLPDRTYHTMAEIESEVGKVL